jgi:hypothetical protein
MFIEVVDPPKTLPPNLAVRGWQTLLCTYSRRHSRHKTVHIAAAANAGQAIVVHAYVAVSYRSAPTRHTQLHCHHS